MIMPPRKCVADTFDDTSTIISNRNSQLMFRDILLQSQQLPFSHVGSCQSGGGYRIYESEGVRLSPLFPQRWSNARHCWISAMASNLNGDPFPHYPAHAQRVKWSSVVCCLSVIATTAVLKRHQLVGNCEKLSSFDGHEGCKFFATPIDHTY